MANELKAGQFYGQVPRKKRSTYSVMTEVIHIDRTSVPKHSHELAHFQLLLNGSYMETCGRKSFISEPMTISWHRPAMTHRDEIGPGGGRFFMIEFQPKAIEQLKELAKLPNDFYVRSHPLVSLAYRAYAEFRRWDLGSGLISEGLTLEMLAHLVRRPSAVERCQPKWLTLVIDKLNADYLENPGTSELAALADVHPVHLASVFRRFYNETMGEYVQRLRIGQATRMLVKTDLPLVDIAYSLGFSDQSHFSRVFKRHTGTTPGAFRSAINK